MQEEQRSLSSIQTISVRGLLMDRSVRWQVITIAVVNIGMQLSGIDAVSVKSIVGLLSFLPLCVCSHFRCAKTVQLLYESERSYCYSSQLCSTHLHLLLPIHHSPTCSHWVTKQGATGPRLIISWSSLLVLPHIRRSTRPHAKSNTFLCSFLRVDGSSLHAGWLTCLYHFPAGVHPTESHCPSCFRREHRKASNIQTNPCVQTINLWHKMLHQTFQESLKWKHACCSKDLGHL